MKNLFLLFFLFIITATNSQVINFPDAKFKEKLLLAGSLNNTALDINSSSITIDVNNDGEIQVAEALNVYFLNIQCDECTGNNNIQNLIGIDFFSNLITLSVAYTGITSLNLNNLTNLIDLTCIYSPLTTVELLGMNSLKFLNLRDNNVVSVNFNQIPSIRDILCDNNNFTEVHLNGLLNLEQVYFGHNNITSFTINNCPQLFSLWCHNNLISEIEVNQLTELISFYCQDNLLTTIDVTNLTLLNEFLFSGNPLLESIFMKNGSYQNVDYSIGLNNINYVCADESEINNIQSIFASNNYTNYTVNSYCSFVPGGEYFEINGNSIFDNDLNGCDISDGLLSYLNLNVTDGVNNGNFIANITGQYSIPVQEGTHTVTPFIENPTYFNISPSSFQVTFPNQSSPFNLNFCITPNGNHNDLEVVIIPLIPARPGFDATYKIVYKNKGNVTQSGNLTFSFEDNKMDYLSSNPTFTNQSVGLLSWNYNDLQPFETREIEVRLNINSPMETPAVNIGDQLNFAATINPLEGDEFLLDNVTSLKQIVVGSFDPNDKTCIEGDIVGPNVIGENVHYVIRFENTGTFPAENIVVKDMIDLTKFDISTLVPISSSHSFVSRINDNKVEFIFENINLPFDDATNDGYIAFKIKTNPTLILGDTFENNASIYFDYNFPIITNTTSTTIRALDTQDFEFSNYFTLYPNPANDILQFRTKNDVSISSINIYNTIGQLLLVETNPNEDINISSLKTGSYFVKLYTNKGITSSRFIKK